MAVAIVGSSPVVPGQPVTVIVAVAVGRLVYSSSSAAASRFRFVTLKFAAGGIIGIREIEVAAPTKLLVVVTLEKSNAGRVRRL